MNSSAPSSNPSFPLPSLAELLERADVVALPMRVSFRGVTVREALLIDAPSQWAEFAPFPEYEPAEASLWLRSAIQYGYGTSRSAPADEWVAVNATIPAVDVDAQPGIIGELMERYPGCTTVKVKVAEKNALANDPAASMRQDVQRVRAVRQWYADQGIRAPKIRMDANGGWTVRQALEVVETLAADGPLDYVEQPCRTVAELAEVRQSLMRRGLFVRVAADEAIRKSADPVAAVKEVTDAGACDVAVLKVPPLGGVDQLRRVASEVAQRGVSITVSSALDTAVGLGAGLQAAASLVHIDDDGMVAEPNAAGLATGTLFERDLAERRIVDGRMHTGAVTPDADRLAEFRLTGERRDWWLDRLRAAYSYLEGER